MRKIHLLIILSAVSLFNVSATFATMDSGNLQSAIAMKNTEIPKDIKYMNNNKINNLIPLRTPQQSFKVSHYDNVKITLHKIRFAGNTVFDQQQLESFYNNLINKNITKQDIVQATQEMIKYYWEKGYYLAQADIHIADLYDRDSQVTVHVNEGYIKDIVYQDSIYKENPQLEKIIQIIKVTKPFNISVFKYSNFSIDQVADIPIKIVVLPLRNSPGAGQLVIKTTQKKYTPYASIDNRGSKLVGPFQATAGFYARSIFKSADTTGVKIRFTPKHNELFGFQVKHITPVSNTSDRINFLYDHSRIKPGSYLKRVSYSGNTDVLLTEYQHVYKGFKTGELNSDFGFKAINNRAKIDTGRLFNDKTREIYATLNTITNTLLNGLSKIEIGIHQGLDIFDQSKREQKSRHDGSTHFTYSTFKIQHTQGLTKDISLFLEGATQYSWKKLLLNNKFYVGGTRFGSGYDAGELGGDHGIGGRAELQFNWDAIFKHLNTAQFYGFVDGGKVWTRASTIPYRNKSLTSAGIGTRTNIFKNYLFKLEIAKPLTKSVIIRTIEGRSKRPLRLFFKLETAF